MSQIVRQQLARDLHLKKFRVSKRDDVVAEAEHKAVRRMERGDFPAALLIGVGIEPGDTPGLADSMGESRTLSTVHLDEDPERWDGLS